jgi:hypothetical protein
VLDGLRPTEERPTVYHRLVSERPDTGARTFMTSKILLIVVLLFAFADPALADWWIVRSSDDTCLVVDIEPRGNDKAVTKVGKEVYATSEQAEADVKKFCGESRGEDQRRDPGNAD